jgi:exodeoxyribonuclease-1
VTFVFYDTETTGLAAGFDQILQFAAIKTDNELNEVDSINVRSRLVPHVVPSPGALAATRVHPSQLIDTKLISHYAKIRQIRAKLLAWSPAIFAGYNSIAFDEELLRQALFQTLHGPYLTNTQGNKRADVMKIAHATAVYRPGVLKIPTDDKGKETFRLELLAPANDYDHKDAHDALADVRATIYIAKLIKDRAPDIWEAMIGNADKQQTIQLLRDEPQLSWTERYGSRSFSWIITSCGVNPSNTGQIAVFDLAHNPDEYLRLSVEEIIKLLGAQKKVIRSVRANAQPIVFPASESPATAGAYDVPDWERKRRVAVIAANPDFQARVGRALSLRFAVEEKPIYVEQRIYDGFANDDEAAMDTFHELEWPKRHAILFKDERVKEFGSRLLYFENPDGLEEERRVAMDNWVSERLTAPEDVPWMTIAKAMGEADKLLEKAPSDKAALLKDTKDFLADMQRRLANR